ncbi:hypothetical protein D3C74_210890 [compost metagenome]
MAVRCLNCNYEMNTWQEATLATTHIFSGGYRIILALLDAFTTNRKGFMAGPMNHEIGASKGVKCPKCGKYGSWEDVSIFSRH